MMKNLLFTLMLFAFSACCYGQDTYYWVGGATASTLTGTNWSLTPGGTAVARSNTSDVLIFDNVTVAFDIGSFVIGKLVVQNSADVSFERSIVSGTGTTTLTLGGSTLPGSIGEGLSVNNAKLRILGSNAGYGSILVFGTGITGAITNAGQLYVTGTASNRVTLPTAGQLTFANGTFCYVNSAGNPFNQTANSATRAVIFNSGSTLTFQGGLNPFGNTAAGYIVDMKSGSNFVMEANNVASIFNGKSFGNVQVKSPAVVTLAENFVNIGNLTIDPGASFLIRGSGASGISGNIVNNGTFNAVAPISSSQLIMLGSSAQSISGTGTFGNLGCFSVGTDATVTLNKSLTLVGTSTSNVIGSLNFQGNVLSGTNSLQFRAAAATSGTGGTDATTNTIQMADVANYNLLAPVPGLLISGPGIPANTYVIGTSSGSFNFTVSKFPTATASGLTITGQGNAPTFITSNTAGVDGSLTTSTKTIGAGTNYIFNATTTTPFIASLLTGNSMGNVTFNAAATTNKDASITGRLTLNNVKLTIATGNTLTFSSTAIFDGIYNQNAYLLTTANAGTGAVGVVKANLLAASAKTIPIGTANYYAPISFGTTDASTFDVNVFDGITNNATPNGTAVSATAKQNAVDAVWNVNRTSGTGNVDLALNWQAGLEGSGFSTLLNAQIGIAQYTSGDYTAFTGTGDNITNVALNNFATMSQFVVGKIGGVLPITLVSFTGKKQSNAVVLSWTTASEQRNSYFSIERSTDGINFTSIGTRTGAGTTANYQSYSFTDNNPTSGNNYYRLVQYDADGKANAVDQVVVVNMGFGDLTMKVANGNASTLNLSISTPNQLAGNFSVYNLSGQKVVAQNLPLDKGTNTYIINLPVLAPGVYIAAYQSGSQLIREKFIK